MRFKRAAAKTIVARRACDVPWRTAPMTIDAFGRQA